MTFSQSDLLNTLDVNNPWQNLWNVGEFQYQQLSYAGGNGSLWGGLSYGSTPTLFEYTIGAGGTLVIEGRYDYQFSNLPGHRFLLAYSYVIPFTLPATSYPFPVMAWGSATGGGGSDVSGYVQILSFEDGGDGYRMVLKNNYSATIYAREIKIVGYFRMILSEEKRTFVQDNAGTGAKKVVTFSTPYMLLASPFTVPIIQTLMSNQMDWINATRLYPKVALESKPDKQFVDVFSMATLSVSYLNIAQLMRCGNVQESWKAPTAQAVETTIVGEPAEW